MGPLNLLPLCPECQLLEERLWTKSAHSETEKSKQFEEIQMRLSVFACSWLMDTGMVSTARSRKTTQKPRSVQQTLIFQGLTQVALLT